MAIIFETYSSTGFLQLSADFSNYKLIQSGVAPPAGASGMSSQGTIAFPSQPTPPIVMVNAGSGTIYGYTSSSTVSYTSTAAFNYKIYARSEDLPTGTYADYGLQIFGSDGKLYFTSADEYFKIKGFGYGTNNLYFTSATGAPIYAVLNDTGVCGFSDLVNGSINYIYVWVVSFTSVTSCLYRMDQIGAAPISDIGQDWTGTRVGLVSW